MIDEPFARSALQQCALFSRVDAAGIDACLVGGSLESVIRLLGDLVVRGLIRFEGDTLVVRDPDGLAAGAPR